MKRLLGLILLMLWSATAYTAEDKEPKWSLGVSGTLLPLAVIQNCESGICHSSDWDLSGGATLSFDYAVLRYLAVGADIGYSRWAHTHDRFDEILLLPHVKAFYMIPEISLETYAKLDVGYSYFYLNNGAHAHAVALRPLVGVLYAIPGTGLAPFFDLGYHWATFASDFDDGEGNWSHVRFYAGAFIMNLGLAYRF